MIVKLGTMNAQEIHTLLREQILCRIAFKDAEYPYIAPFQYVYLNDALYFHLTDYGKKMRLLQRDNRVCVEIEKIQPDLREYNFVSLRGTLTSVDDPTERRTVIKRMAEDGQKKLSTNFLAAHGLKPTEGWASFMSEKPLLIFKLDILESIGVKSP
jgi:nitroimidazol reductase NimA-like FMN-containing flavoprotein (pyridoxamine 5'-phosphate oxidase superfamily)